MLRPAAISTQLPKLQLQDNISAVIRQHIRPLMIGTPELPRSRALAPAIGCAIVRTDGSGACGIAAEGLRFFPSSESPRPNYTEFEMDALKNKVFHAQGDQTRQRQVFVDPQLDRWHFGSNMKSITAVCIQLILADNNLHSTKVTVGDVLQQSRRFKTKRASGDGKSAIVVPDALKSVTLQQLLDHRSGLDDRLDVYGISFSSFAGWKKFFKVLGSTYHGATTLWQDFRFDNSSSSSNSEVLSPTEQRIEIISRLFERWNASGASFSDGVESRRGSFNYSNFGYLIAAAMAEEICMSGSSSSSSSASAPACFEDILRREIFEPLRMETADFGEPRSKVLLSSNGTQENVRGFDHRIGLTSNRSKYFEIDPRNGTALPPALNPAGNMHCTLLDFCRWEQYHNLCLKEHIAERKKVAAAAAAQSSTTVTGTPEEKQRQLSEGLTTHFYDTSASYPTAPSSRNKLAGVSNYSSGLIKVNELRQITAELDRMKEQKKNEAAFDPATVSVKNMLGEFYLHDGSTGAWCAEHILVPKRNIAGVIVANACNDELPPAMIQALRSSLLDVLNL